jgi:hypothetical protein
LNFWIAVIALVVRVVVSELGRVSDRLERLKGCLGVILVVRSVVTEKMIFSSRVRGRIKALSILLMASLSMEYP